MAEEPDTEKLRALTRAAVEERRLLERRTATRAAVEAEILACERDIADGTSPALLDLRDQVDTMRRELVLIRSEGDAILENFAALDRSGEIDHAGAPAHDAMCAQRDAYLHHRRLTDRIGTEQ